MTTRLGLDVGTNSIGWCLYDRDSILGIGVRVFPDGRDAKTGASLAVDRRQARAMRRRRDRYLGRRSALLRALIDTGLMPADKAEAQRVAALDPYPLRAKGVSQPLAPHELGRVLFHLNQRRGFKWSRKTDRDPDEKGKIADGINALNAALDGRTYGQFLATNNRKRVRKQVQGDGYDFYPERTHLEDEFDRIWAAQAQYNPALLTDALRDRLRQIVFFQRALKKPKVGGCTFFNEEERLPKSAPLFQELRLYQEVNHLKIERAGETARHLTVGERDALIRRLKGKRTVSFKTLAKTIGLREGESFNEDRGNRSGLAGDDIHASFADKKAFGTRWARLDDGTQFAVIEMVENEPDPEVLYKWLIVTLGVSEEQAQAIGQIRLPDGHGRLGESASRAILTALKAEVITYDQAVARAIEPHHSDFRTGQIRGQLPYYGELLSREIPPGTLNPEHPDEQRWGKITNPTVHIVLNQLQKLVNAVIVTYGRPDEIVVKLARELKLNETQKARRNRELVANSRAAQARGAQLRELGQADNGGNRMLLRIWEELNPADPLDRRCPFCGGGIAVDMLFNQKVKLEHVIPYSRSLDDSTGNKVIAHRVCSREKGNMTPWERWGGTDRWPAIAAQAARLHKSKQWRFGPAAIVKFEDADGVLAQPPADTHYLAHMMRRYLAALYPESAEVHVIRGRMTAMLRRIWGLNDVLPDHGYVANRHSDAPNNRLDHRHHAIDAAVIGMTDRGLMQRIAHAAGRAKDHDLDGLFADLDQPWQGFRDDLRSALQAITVSHKPDHGRTRLPRKDHDVTAGRLHNDTAYGLTGEVNDKGIPIVVRRKMLLGLKPEDIATVADRALQAALYDATKGRTGKEFESALRRFSSEGTRTRDRNGEPLFKDIRRVRVRQPLNIIPIRDAAGRAYKGYKGDANARYDVWAMPDGKWVTRWKDQSGRDHSSIVSMLEAHDRKSVSSKPHPAAKRVLRLRQNDLLAIERDGAPREIVRVVKFASTGNLVLAPHNEAGALKSRDADRSDPFKYINLSASGLRRDRARQIRINYMGHILDPGWRSPDSSPGS